mmetsp:Transcript_8005/g.11900  ORF Transcript_8005/g.11900 Transcript_8005/m.11900 type:complete len:263 (+) Transcript_8005:1006-1794(+)
MALEFRLIRGEYVFFKFSLCISCLVDSLLVCIGLCSRSLVVCFVLDSMTSTSTCDHGDIFAYRFCCNSNSCCLLFSLFFRSISCPFACKMSSTGILRFIFDDRLFIFGLYFDESLDVLADDGLFMAGEFVLMVDRLGDFACSYNLSNIDVSLLNDAECKDISGTASIRSLSSRSLFTCSLFIRDSSCFLSNCSSTLGDRSICLAMRFDNGFIFTLLHKFCSCTSLCFLAISAFRFFSLFHSMIWSTDRCIFLDTVLICGFPL